MKVCARCVGTARHCLLPRADLVLHACFCSLCWTGSQLLTLLSLLSERCSSLCSCPDTDLLIIFLYLTLTEFCMSQFVQSFFQFAQSSFQVSDVEEGWDRYDRESGSSSHSIRSTRHVAERSWGSKEEGSRACITHDSPRRRTTPTTPTEKFVLVFCIDLTISFLSAGSAIKFDHDLRAVDSQTQMA